MDGILKRENYNLIDIIIIRKLKLQVFMIDYVFTINAQ
jgi:hypothetical protein